MADNITVTQKAKLNNMCKSAQDAGLGTLLDNRLPPYDMPAASADGVIKFDTAGTALETQTYALAAAIANITKAAAAAGTAQTFARGDHKHDVTTAAAVAVTPDTTNGEGAATSLARSNHTHTATCAAPSAALTSASTNAAGVAATFARSDHAHTVTGLPTSDEKAGLAANTPSAANPVLTNGQISTDKQAALAGTGTPSAGNKFVTNDTLLSTVRNLDFKNSVRLATAAALPACDVTPAGGGVALTLTENPVAAALVVDGVNAAIGDRIGVKNQVAPENNGIFDVIDPGDGITNPWILRRSADADSDAEVTSGLCYHVNEGTANADTDWYLTTNDPIVLDTTGLTFALNARLPTANEKAGLSANTPSATNAVQTLAQIRARQRKLSCRLATAAALPACTAAGTGVGKTLTGDAVGQLADQDGITPVQGDRLLVKNQVAGKDNGIYVVTVLGDGATAFVLTRAVDADSDAEVTCGMKTFIEEGTVNHGLTYYLTTANPFTLDTDAIAFGISAYLPTASSYVQEYVTTVTHAEYTAGAQSENYALPAFPTNTLLVGGFVELDTEFSGGGTASADVELGDAGNTDELASTVNVFTGAGAALKAGVPTAFIGFEPAYAPVARMTVDGAHVVSDLAAGSMEVHVLYVPCTAHTP